MSKTSAVDAARQTIGWAWWFPKSLRHKPKVHMMIQRGKSIVALCGQIPWGTCVSGIGSDKDPLEKCTMCLKKMAAARTGSGWTEVKL